MSRNRFNELSPCETLIMKLIWEAPQDIPVQELIDQLRDDYGKDYARTTVVTFVGKLKDKRFVDTYRKGKAAFIHPLRSEEEYKGMSLDERRKILKKLMAFIRHIDISYKTIYIEKKHIKDSIEATGKLSKQLSSLIRENMDLFCSFDVVKIYYDNGQVEVTRVLSSVFNALLENVEFRKVIPSQYRLFQVADLICTLKLTELKLENHTLSKSEKAFFEDERTLKKNYLKPIKKKEL